MRAPLSSESGTLTEMGGEVKRAPADGQRRPRRSYDNSRRRAQTGETRHRVIEAARRLFLERGYPATTIEAVSEASDTPLATLYRLFGSKRGVLKAVLDVTFVGDEEPVALHDRPDALQAASESGPRRMLGGYAHLARTVLERSAPLQQVLRTAAIVDVEAAALLDELRQQRAQGQARVVSGLQARNALSGRITPEEALDIIYALMSPELHWLLTRERGWDNDQYETWLTSTLHSTLVDQNNGD